MPDSEFMELVIRAVATALLNHLSSLNDGAAVVCAEVADWSEARTLAVHDIVLAASASEQVRVSWMIFKTGHDDLRTRVLRSAQERLRAEGDRVVNATEIASFTFAADEHNQPADVTAG